jgi:hypothetical protein
MARRLSQLLHLIASAGVAVLTVTGAPPAVADSRDDWCATHSDPQRCLSAEDVYSLAQQEKNVGSPDGAVAIMVAAGAASGQPEVIAAAGAYKAAADLLKMFGAFDSQPDPTALAMQRVQTEIDQIRDELKVFQSQIQGLQNQLYRQNNQNQLEFLNTWMADVRAASDAITFGKPTDPQAVNFPMTSLQNKAALFLPAQDPRNPAQGVASPVWMWSVAQLDKAPDGTPVGRMLDPAFEYLPAFRYYGATLAAWMSVIQYRIKIAPQDRDRVLAQVRADLLRHASYLRFHSGTLRAATQTPLTLPDYMLAREQCQLQVSTIRPDAKGNCSLHGACSLFGAGIGGDAGQFPFKPQSAADNDCTRQQYSGDNGIVDSMAIDLARKLGADAMETLAKRLEKLAATGIASLCEPPAPSFNYTYYTKQILYAVKPNGEMQWYDDLIIDDRNPPAQNVRDPCSPSLPGGVAATPAGMAAAARAAGVAASANAPSGVGPRLGTPATSASLKAALAANQTPASPSRAPLNRMVSTPIDKVVGTHKITRRLDGPVLVGTGWQQFKDVIPAGGTAFYGLTPTGGLVWYRHDGFNDGANKWTGPVTVGTGWNNFKKIFAGGDGVLYGIGTDGSLRWYRQADAANATAQPRWSGPNVVGTGWGNFVQVFSTGEGVIYAITTDGKLMWYRHKGYLTGTSQWDGPKQVGTGWAAFKRVFSVGNGAIYAVQPNGDLLWYQHTGYQDGSTSWQGPLQVSTRWDGYATAFALLPDAAAAPPQIH